MEKPIVKVLHPLYVSIDAIARDVDGTNSDLVKYPGYTNYHAIARLKRIADNLRAEAKRVDGIIKEYK